MKQSIILTSITASMLTFIGCGDSTGSAIESSGANSLNYKEKFTPIASDNSIQVKNLNNVSTYSLKSTHFEPQQKTTKSLQAVNRFLEGQLEIINNETNQSEIKDWSAYIDDEAKVMLSEQTMVLEPGNYTFNLILTDNDKQYMASAEQTVVDTNNLNIKFDVFALVGNIVTDVSTVNSIPSFKLNLPEQQMKDFINPKIGFVINGGDELFISINNDGTVNENAINLRRGDTFVSKFYDGNTQKGKSGEITVDSGTFDIDFIPLYGEVNFASGQTLDSNLSLSMNVPSDVIDEAGNLNNLQTIFAYSANGEYKEKNVSLNFNDVTSIYNGNVEIPNWNGETITYSLIFNDASTGEKIGSCTIEDLPLSKNDISNNCEIDLAKEILANARFTSVLGINALDENGFGKAGVSVFVNDEFIGYTGSGAFGATGYIKTFVPNGAYTIKAVDNNVSFFNDVNISTLSVNNLIVNLKNGVSTVVSSMDKSSFSLDGESEESTYVNIRNNGVGDVSYNVVIENSDKSSKSVKAAFEPISYQMFATANSTTGIINIEYIDNLNRGEVVGQRSVNFKDLGNNIIVRYKEGKNINSVDGYPSRLSTMKLDAKNAVEYVKEMNTLANDPKVLYVEPDYPISTFNNPTEELYSLQWGLNNTGSKQGYFADADIDYSEYYGAVDGDDDNKVIVAVIDSGVQYTHPDLKNNMWVNRGEIPENGIDDDGNGYVDDIFGYDFVDNNGNPDDVNGHGTHVAGIIGASENGKGTIGVNRTVQIMALKFIGANGSGSTSAAVKAIEYAINNGAHITNNSWGGAGFSNSLFEVISKAQNAGQLFIAASGNEGVNIDNQPTYPASYDLDNIVVVGSISGNEELSSFSNYGPQTVDILAPGDRIASTYTNNGYAFSSGTSMAAPFVTGVASLMLEKYPDANYRQLKNGLKKWGSEITSAVTTTNSGKLLNVNDTYLNFKTNNNWIKLGENKTGVIKEGHMVEVPVIVNGESMSNQNAVIKVETNNQTFTFDVNLNILN
jgi:subtilisin family serine protease